MANENLGIAHAAIERAERFACLYPTKARKFMGRAPVYKAGPAIKITVDCRTGKRVVEKPEPPVAETRNPFTPKHIPVDLRYRYMPSIAWLMGERQRVMKKLAAPRIATRDKFGRKHVKLEHSYASAIVTICAECWGIDRSHAMMQSRKRVSVRPRQAAFKLLYEHSGVSYVQIGKYFNLDHTTVMHGRRKATDLILTDLDFRHRYEQAADLLEKAIRGEAA